MNRQRHKLSRRILAMLLAAAMLVTMFPAAMFAAPETGINPVETIEPGPTSKSKTATELELLENGKYQSEVTLSLPAADEKLASDIVFVIDKSSSSKYASTQQGLEMLSQLPDDAEINFGAIVFDGAAYVAYELQKFDSSKLDEISQAINTKPGEEAIGGTNIDAGLTAAKAMLEKANDGVDDSRKYVILVSDGLTRLFTGTDGKTKIIFNEQYAEGTSLFGDFTTWCLANDFNDGEYKVPGNDWDQYFEKISNFVKTDGDTYVVDYQKDKSTMSLDDPDVPDNYIEYDERADHALCVDRSIYEAFKAYEELSAYNCYAVFTGNSELGQTIMSELNGGQEIVDFDSIGKDINYLLDNGSYVIDEIGSGIDNHNNAYNFDFVQSETLTMKVGNETLTAERVTESLPEGESARYTFGEDRFVLHYYQNGTTASDSKFYQECFIWDINEAVSQFAPVQLTYTVELQKAQTDAGEYGSYESDGQDDATGEYLNDEERSLFTNNQAVLYPKETTADTVGEPEYFAKPTVSYTVAPTGTVTITPADITVYTGGQGYESVMDGTGEAEVVASNGLPTPGYLITLPESINNDFFGGNQEAANLSGQVRFVYDGNSDGDYIDAGTDRVWNLKMYSDGDSQTAPEDGIARYVYRMDADSLSGEPIRMLFSNNGEEITSDYFTISLENGLYRTYGMTIYPGLLDSDAIKAQVLVDGTVVVDDLDVEVGTATLTVRGTTDAEDINAVGNDTDAVAENDHHITAVAPTDTKYYINESQVEVDPDKVSLLSDALVDTDPLKEYIVNNDIAGSDENYEYRYLDLVDNTNGNAYVTATNPIDVYWALPEGADSDDDFRIVHFNALDREYTDLDQMLNNNEPVVYSMGDGLEIVEIDNKYYLKFSTDSFSPFVLVWDEADDNPPYIPPSTGDDDDKPDTPSLNKDDHFLYIEGYPEDYRTGEYSDNEDLWPVKPQGNITRAEVATIFYRLLKDEVREEIETDVNSFPDVNADDWFNVTVSSLANMNVISGYEDGTFRPNEPITRAELAAMAGRFYEAFDAEYEEGTFLDVEGDEWFADAIAAAAELGILGGYPDGTVRPNNNITRAETCAIVNRVLERRPHDEHLGDVDDMRTWPDNLPGAWYYADMQEATNGHYYIWIDIDGVDFEEWTEVDKDYDWTKR